MLLELATNNLWVALLIWILLYISDYTLTLLGARLRAASANPYVTTQGSYELNTYFVKDVDQRRRVSIRFLLSLVWTTFLLGMIWLLARTDAFVVFLFQIAFGGMILLELAVHVRHLRNILSFRRQSQVGEIQGQVQFSRRYVYWTSALDLGLFAILYLVLFIIVGSPFLVGGVLSCAALALRHRLRLKREPLLTVA